MRDTSQRAQQRYYELLRGQSAQARLATAVRLTSAVRELAETAIRNADPSVTEVVVRARLARRLYGRSVAERLFPSVTQDGG
jgi:hypothetical protein